MKQAISEELKRIFNRSPFIVDLGIQLDSLGDGKCTTVLLLQPRHLQQDGYVHAGVQATMADHTAGAAAASHGRGVDEEAQSPFLAHAGEQLDRIRQKRIG
jgi:acyl-coenzyme A thioesterase PaaI-like protein